MSYTFRHVLHVPVLWTVPTVVDDLTMTSAIHVDGKFDRARVLDSL